MGSLCLSQSLIFQESQPKSLYLLSQGEVTYFIKVSAVPWLKGEDIQKEFQKERDLSICWDYLIIDTIVGGSPGIVFPIVVLESCLYVLFSLNFGGSRLCVAFKLLLIS
jgi:hypothetical protein